MTNDAFIIQLRLSERAQHRANEARMDHHQACRYCQGADLLASWCENLGTFDHGYHPCAEGQRLIEAWQASKRHTVTAWDRVHEVPENERMGRSPEYEAALLAAHGIVLEGA